MPPRQKRRRHGDRHVNVFVQDAAPKGRAETDEAGDDESSAATGAAGESATRATQAISASRARRLRAQRVARQTSARSDVFTRSMGKELRKLGVVSGGIAVILAVLTFAL